MSTPRRILLVGPVFHGYTSAIGTALRRRGHMVTVHHYDERGTAGKVWTKLGSELPQRFGLPGDAAGERGRATDRALAALRDARAEVVIAIKADALEPAFWDAARRSGAVTLLWLYDEMRRMHLDPEVLTAVDLVASYSALDTQALLAEGLPATHVRNGFDDSVAVDAVPAAEVLFVGARYDNRAALLAELVSRGVPVRAVGRDWSHHWADRLRTWQVARPDVPALRDVTRPRAYGLMAGAAASINMHHDQDGFTMRTFEIPGCGGLQVIDRADVCDLYEVGREVVVYESVDEAEELCRRALADHAWASRIGQAGRARTLAEHTLGHRVADLEGLWG